MSELHRRTVSSTRAKEKELPSFTANDKYRRGGATNQRRATKMRRRAAASVFLFTCSCLFVRACLRQQRTPYKAHPLMIHYATGAVIRPTSHKLKKDAKRDRWRRGEEERQDIPSVDDDECEYRDWHYNETFMQCNSMHEIRMVGDDSLQYIACGGSRCVFRLSNDIDQSYLALKVEHYHTGERQISENILKQHRKDSMVMERLTSSPYVPNIYSACGSSQLVEYADNGNLHDLIKVARQSREDNMSSVDKLGIAVQVAEGTAAIHSFEKDGVASLSHNDLDCQQFVLCDGVFKINDFHWAEFIPKNQMSNEMCRMYNKDKFGEHYYKTRPVEAFDYENKVDLTKIDTYNVGNVLWYLLTNKWMFEGEHVKKVRKKVKRGERPNFPEYLRESKDPAIVAIRKAITDCWTHDPDERPTSVEIRDFLRQALKSITGEAGVVRVSVPPLPKDHRYTESDYYGSLIW